jgi:predicted nucleotidyltransferase
MRQHALERIPPFHTSPAAALFTNTQQRLLKLLFGQPDRSFYANELIALSQGGTGAIQRELAKLVQAELVSVKRIGNQKHYQSNAQSPLFEELCRIVQKTVGLAEPLRAALEPFGARIHAAFVYGSVAKRQDTASSDIDLMVISPDITYAELFTVLEHLHQELGREINPTVYTPLALRQRLAQGGAFASRVMSQPKIWVIGNLNALDL